MLRIALVQTPPVFLNLPASIARATSLITQAADEGAQVIVFPESWLPGYPVWLDEAPGAALWGHAPAEALYRHLVAHSPVIDGPEIAALTRVAQARNVLVVMGLHERRGSSLYNSVVLLGEATLHVHRKLMPTHNERILWAAADGSTLGAWPTRVGTFGALICWEHWMPLARAAKHATGEQLHFALWPEVSDLHLLASRHYAFEGQCFVVAAGCVITRDDVLAGFDSTPNPDPVARQLLDAIPLQRTVLKNGGSAVIAPDSTLRLGPCVGECGLQYCDIDLDRAADGRLYLDTCGHYARPDIFELRVDARPRPGTVFIGEPPAIEGSADNRVP